VLSSQDYSFPSPTSLLLHFASPPPPPPPPRLPAAPRAAQEVLPAGRRGHFGSGRAPCGGISGFAARAVVDCAAGRGGGQAFSRSRSARRQQEEDREPCRCSGMYAPQSSRGAGASGSAAEQPRVYQVWRGSNVSALSVSLSRFGAVCSRNSGSGSGRLSARACHDWLARGLRVDLPF
jgi:hypothetical protein